MVATATCRVLVIKKSRIGWYQIYIVTAASRMLAMETMLYFQLFGYYLFAQCFFITRPKTIVSTKVMFGAILSLQSLLVPVAVSCKSAQLWLYDKLSTVSGQILYFIVLMCRPKYGIY